MEWIGWLTPLASLPLRQMGQRPNGCIWCQRVTLRAAMAEIARPMLRLTAQAAAYVEVLGADLAVEFLLKCGGADLYLPSDPKGNSAVEKLLGYDKLKARAARRQQARNPDRHPSRGWRAASAATDALLNALSSGLKTPFNSMQKLSTAARNASACPPNSPPIPRCKPAWKAALTLTPSAK